MKYTSLDTIPYKLFLKIIGDPVNIKMLSDESCSTADLEAMWEAIYKEYLEMDPSGENMKVFHVEREIAALECKYDCIKTSVHALEFAKNDDLIQLLKDMGYVIRQHAYNSDLAKIKRESAGIIVKIGMFRTKLPKVDEVDAAKKPNVDDLLASYSAILGIDFDYNTVSFTKVHSLERQVSAKVKALENTKVRRKNKAQA